MFFLSIISAGARTTCFWTCHLRLSTSKVQLNLIHHKKCTQPVWSKKMWQAQNMPTKNNKSSCYTLNIHLHLKHSQFRWLNFFSLFNNVCFQMGPQIACLWRCILTLVAFVWLFSTVRFQMSPQTACLRGCIVTLGAYIWLYEIVNCILRDFPICFLQTKVMIFKILFHCYCVLCFVQMTA